MINLDFDGEVDNIQKQGYYFRPISHICKYYLIEVAEKKDINCLVKIYELGIPQKNGEALTIKNGERIASFEADYIGEINVYGKYFFPKFADHIQCYHNQSYKNQEWEFDENGNMDEFLALAEVMKFALSLGIKIGNIELY